MPTHIYRSLEQGSDVRLLELAPGSRNEPLRGVLRHTSLSKTGDYEAISYVWGSDIKCQTLETMDGTIAITASLHSALKQLRFSNASRILWADALCINQYDNAEKSSQVRLMYKIYSQATKVVAYLGDEADDSELIPPLLEDMISRDLFDKGSVGSLARSRFSNEMLGPLAALMCRPWFRRAWIIQEFLAAKDIVMVRDSWEVHWATLYKAVDNSYSFSELSLNFGAITDENKIKSNLTSRGSIAFSTLDMGRDRTRAENGDSRIYSSLLDLFELYQDKEATRKRDHLFALLSLANDTDDSAFDPDYAEPFEKIVRRYAGAFIRQKHCFRLLVSAGLNSEPSRFPTWIPDWTIRRKTRFFEGFAVNMDTYRAAASTEVVAHFDEHADELIMKGGYFDQIVQVVQPWKEGEESSLLSEDAQALYLRQCDDLIHSYGSYLTGESLFDVQWRTLIANRDDDGQDLDDHLSPAMRQSYLAFRKELSVPAPDAYDNMLLPKPLQIHTGGKAQSEEEQLTKDFNPYSFDSVFFRLTHHYTACLTKRGCVCLVPKEARINDIICVFYGCPVPFVIRRSQIRQGNLFHLVGVSYVHGFMDGEILSAEGFEETYIHLH